jgi:hypothetical protein
MVTGGSGSTPPVLADLARHENDKTLVIFARMAEASGTGAWATALLEFAALARRVRARLRFCEDVVFPLFELRAGPTELTRTLVRQHREIEGGLRDLEECLRERRLDDLPADVRALRRALDEHHGRTARMVLPLLDRLLTDDERARLASRFDPDRA